MYLMLMRHGEAVPQTENISNRDRKLTREGKRQVRKVSRILARFLKERPLRIYTSPFLRTRQTARILSEECFAEGLHTSEDLLQGDFQMVANHILTEGGPVALVSHHPFLQSYLLFTGHAAVKFEPGAVAVIDYDFRWKQGQLVAYFTPQLKKLKKDD